ncbi:hypothetical protein SRABI76_02418 [Microbacterium oxydans]|uniref:VanZ like family protein n=1 Tax=Microbacterium oxydans TaxID=82380 RepID=A0A0F0LB07_9MICO|nr:VanZ family protein [Microbacterium oxydans]KJL30308.1 VanZ like family protein [Microbacterium oxydans]CAH0217285.1 hypothetical protein SRABI76_02418 [Microbacterium oxydans]
MREHAMNLATSVSFSEVPALPVVVPLGLALFTVLLWRLRATRRFTAPRAAVAAALSVYAAGVIANTVFPIFLDKPDTGVPWTPHIALIPFADYEVSDALMNMAVFLPLGMLIPLLLSRPTWAKVIAIAAAASLGIEASQLAAQGMFDGGHIADINDFLSNVIGGALGYGLLWLLTRSPRLSRFVEHFRWTPSAGQAVAASEPR